MFIQKIECIDVWSEDYERLAKWYEEVLELTPVQKLNLPDDTGVVFDISGIFLYIGKHSEVRGKSKDPKRIMLEFRVESVSKVYKKLSHLGVEFIRKPEMASTGDMHVATVLDPDGNVIQFIGGE